MVIINPKLIEWPCPMCPVPWALTDSSFEAPPMIWMVLLVAVKKSLATASHEAESGTDIARGRQPFFLMILSQVLDKLTVEVSCIMGVYGMYGINMLILMNMDATLAITDATLFGVGIETTTQDKRMTVCNYCWWLVEFWRKIGGDLKDIAGITTIGGHFMGMNGELQLLMVKKVATDGKLMLADIK